MLNVTINSRAFSSGFDIRTPVGIYSAKRVPFSPSGETQVFDASGNQVARLQVEGFFSSVYNIIITGGGFYRFRRDGRETWICEGEGRLLSISEPNKCRFLVVEDAQEIAECLKSRLFCVGALGKHTAFVGGSSVRQLAAKFLAANFYSMDDAYEATVTDMPFYDLSISIDGQKKEVTDYVGPWVGMPAVIRELENDVDALAETKRWIQFQGGKASLKKAPTAPGQSPSTRQCRGWK